MTVKSPEQISVMAPGDIVKVRLQCQTKSTKGAAVTSKPKYRGPVHCLLSILREDGVRGLYRGALPLMLRDGPSYGLYFLTYKTVSQLLTDFGDKKPSECERKVLIRPIPLFRKLTIKYFNESSSEVPVISCLPRLDWRDVWRGRGGDGSLDRGDAHGRGEGSSADGRPAGQDAIQKFLPLSHRDAEDRGSRGVLQKLGPQLREGHPRQHVGVPDLRGHHLLPPNESRAHRHTTCRLRIAGADEPPLNYRVGFYINYMFLPPPFTRSSVLHADQLTLLPLGGAIAQLVTLLHLRTRKRVHNCFNLLGSGLLKVVKPVL